MDVNIRELSPFEAPAFATFTFPAYRELFLALDPSVLACGLYVDGSPAGLALGVLAGEASAKALSILVTAANRGRGLGRQLLNAFERQMAERGCTTVAGQVTGSDDRSLPIEKLLTSHGWQFSGPSSVMCYGEDKRFLEAPWLVEAKLLKSMEVFPWLDLTPAERTEIIERQAATRWFPDIQNPFWNEHLIAPSSTGLRHRGRVVGWSVVYYFEPQTVRWWRVFIEPELQRTACMVPLVAEMVRRSARYGIHYAVWNAPTDDERIMGFLERRIRPWLTSAKPVWEIRKQLNVGLP